MMPDRSAFAFIPAGRQGESDSPEPIGSRSGPDPSEAGAAAPWLLLCRTAGERDGAKFLEKGLTNRNMYAIMYIE